jgi:hypothetical protein
VWFVIGRICGLAEGVTLRKKRAEALNLIRTAAIGPIH